MERNSLKQDIVNYFKNIPKREKERIHQESKKVIKDIIDIEKRQLKLFTKLYGMD